MIDLSSMGLDEEVITFLSKQSDFVIDRISQEGGNCDMFFGYHKIFDRRIALKVYYGNEKANSHYEPRTLSKVDHPNILRVRDAKRIGDYYSYFMTDEISGGDLEEFYKTGKLDLKESLDVIHGILNGLTELHKDAVAIVHRDLKPKNILIDNKTKQPLISDFGSIKHLNKVLGKVSGSKTTLAYTPKKVFDFNTYTRQSDIYQVGVIMFQILGGNFPEAYVDWLSEKEKSKLKAIIGHFEQSVFIEKVIQKLVVKNGLLDFESLPKYINKKIVKVISKATHPNLSIRYSSTGEFMNELYKVQKTLVNWKEEGNTLFAFKPNGEEFKIEKTKKGYVTERRKNGFSWRKKVDCTNDIETHINLINN